MNRHSNFGFSTILLAFVMLCILTFSALALLSANSDYKLSQKAANNNTAYYNAELEAYRTLAKIDYALAASFRDSSDEAAYYSLVKEALPAICDGDITESTDGCRISYAVTIQDGQTLCVTLSICYPVGANDNFYEILEWKSVHEPTDVEEEPFHLMG
jgi:type II secretory pathway pseudopilin PulG